jgi:hypothetical protein
MIGYKNEPSERTQAASRPRAAYPEGVNRLTAITRSDLPYENAAEFELPRSNRE